MKFHIIIPTYNRADLLPRAIDSVLNQENVKEYDFHIYIIDDGSTDNTKEVIQKYLEKYPDKITYKYKENGGVGSARNVGIDLALKNSKNPKNDWVIFLDSDDELTQDAFEKIEKEINKYNKVDLIKFSVINQKGEKKCFNCKEGMVSFKELINGCSKGECLPIGKLIIFEKNKFPEGINGGESILWKKIEKNYNIALSNKVVRIYHQDNEGLTRGLLTQEKIENQIKILELSLKQEGNNYINLFVLARMYALKGQKNKSLKYFFKSLKYGFDFKRIILYFISLLPFGLGLKLNNFLIKLQLKKLK